MTARRLEKLVARRAARTGETPEEARLAILAGPDAYPSVVGRPVVSRDGCPGGCYRVPALPTADEQ